MKLPATLTAFLRRRAHRIAQSREPDFVIGGNANPYLRRWFVIPRNTIFNIYVHHFMRSDDDRALHDHPWWNVSILLEGAYNEHTIKAGGVNVRSYRAAGELKFRSARSAHRVELITPPPIFGGKAQENACWTLFITGPRIREWGFHCPAGWKHWKDFTKPGASGEIGPGCDQ